MIAALNPLVWPAFGMAFFAGLYLLAMLFAMRRPYPPAR